MYNKWKIRLFGGVVVLLIISSIYLGYFWYQSEVTKKELAINRVQLDATRTQLADTESQLGTTQTQLVDTENQLDATQTQLADTENQLDITMNELTVSQSRLETVENEKEQMLNQYTSLREQVNVRSGLTVEDRQSFITPSSSLVSSKVLEVTGGYSENASEYWRDFELLYRWVVNNISYSYDSYLPLFPESMSGGLQWRQDYWRKPEETIGDETGDCEDMAVLLASMLKSYNEGRYAVWVLGISSSPPEAKGHLAVAFPVQGGRLTILDPAGNYYTGYPYWSLASDSVSVAVNSWLSYLQSKMPNAKITEVFSENVYEEFSSTAEFIAWAQD